MDQDSASPVHPPLVLLPGLMCDARIFAAQLARFPTARAIDGFGERSSIGDMAHHVLDTVLGSFALLGHSMGARVALEVVRRAPARVTRLMLVSTGTHAVRPGEAERRQRLIDLGNRRGVAALVDQWLPPMLAPVNRANPAVVGPLDTMCRKVGVAAFVAQNRALLARPALETLLPTITCPTMIACGSEDEWSPLAQHEQIRAAIPGSHTTVVAGAGHMLPAEAPDALNEVIAAWLSLPLSA